MSQTTEHCKKREEVEALIQEMANGMPTWEGPFEYNPNLGLSLEAQLHVYGEIRFIEGVSKKIKDKTGEPVIHKSKREQFFKALITQGPLSDEQLTKLFPKYDYCISELMGIEVNAGYVIKEGNVYRITERGQQFVKYGLGKNFLKLNDK